MPHDWWPEITDLYGEIIPERDPWWPRDLLGELILPHRDPPKPPPAEPRKDEPAKRPKS
jgi:hypothetical protein